MTPLFLIIIILPLTLHLLITALIARASGVLAALVFFFLGGMVLFFSVFFFPLLILYIITAFILIMPSLN